MNKIYITKILLYSLLAMSSLYLYNVFFRNPISYLNAKSKIENYIKENYNDNLEIENVYFNSKMNAYSADVRDKKYYLQVSTINYTVYNKINDDYHFRTKLNMENEINTIISAMINQQTNLKRNFITVNSLIDIPLFKYRINEHFSGNEKIKLEIELHSEKDKLNNKVFDNSKSLYKNKADFIKDAYEIIKVLQGIGYSYESIEIYSYLSDGNSKYSVNLHDIKNINDVQYLDELLETVKNIK